MLYLGGPTGVGKTVAFARIAYQLPLQAQPQHIAPTDSAPHRSRYWLNAKTKTVDPVAFAEQIETICTLYADAPLLHALGGHIVSCDKMTGIQALERIAPTQLMRKGQPERREFECKRHGTLSLIANFAIVTGQIVQPSLGPRRTEDDFVRHITQTLATDPPIPCMRVTGTIVAGKCHTWAR